MFWGKQTSKSNQEEPESTDSSRSITELALDPVSHVEQYLSYYVSRLAPGYAVLVTGGWGSGKTYQIRRVLPETHAHYVSLFGLNSPAEVEAQVFAAMFPGRSGIKKWAEKIDEIQIEVPFAGALNTGGLSSMIAGIFIKDNVDTSKPLIFDDLERSTIDIKVILGIINRYVEHLKCRVIVIAHDEKIVKGFEEAKEKLFGQTISVIPDAAGAFDGFVNEFAEGECKRVLLNHKDSIISVFRESGADSLRILRHVVEDLVRLLKVLDGRHLAHPAAVFEVVRLFSALAIEVRSGKLRRDDLANRAASLRNLRLGAGRKEAMPPSAIAAAVAKYKSVDIGSNLLHDEVIVETLIEGRYSQGPIQLALDTSAYFLEEEKAAPWQIVGGFDRLDDELVNDALARMEKQFTDRAVVESGELLHIVALKMMMAYRGLTGTTVDDVKLAAIKYIDDLLASDRLPPRPAGFDWTEPFNSSFAGVQYWVHPEYQTHFSEVFKHLVQARIKALEKRLPDLAKPLLDVVRHDGQKFFEKVCYTRDRKIEYEDVPVLAYIDAKDFVAAWMESPKTGWYWTANAIKERRKAMAHYPSLSPEGRWFPKVRAELERRAKKASGLEKLRIIRAVEQTGIPEPSPRTRKAPPKSADPKVS